MKILITGGYGFIGSFVAETFYKEGHAVSIMDNLSTGKRNSINFRHNFYKLNIEDVECEKVFRSNKFDVVIHLASQPTNENQEVHEASEPGTSTTGLANILHLSEKYGVKKFVFASSAEVYGPQNELPIKEDATCNPVSISGINKWINELYCKKREEIASDIEILCFRLSNVYGPRQGQVNEGGVISTFIKQILAKKELVVYGDGEQTRDFIYVQDVAEVIYQGVEKGLTGTYNLSGNKEISVNKVIEYLLKLEDVKGLTYKEAREGEMKNSRLDNTRVKQDLEWEPLHTFSEGLEKTYTWYKQNSSGKQKKTYKNIEKQKEAIKPAIPFLENLSLFALAIIVSILLEDYLFMVDYQLFYIVITAFLLGRKQALLSVGLSSIWFLYENILIGRDLVTLIMDHNSLIHIGLYIFTGLIIGYTLDKNEKALAEAKSEADSAKEKHQSLSNAYRETLKVNEELKNQVLYTDDSLGVVYTIVKELDSLNPSRIYSSSIRVMEQIMKSKEIGLYMMDQSQKQLQLASKSKDLQIQRSWKIEESESLMKVIQTGEVYVNKDLDQTLPSMIAPLMIEGNFIGVVTLYNANFENLTLSKQNAMAVTSNLISSALHCAYQHQEIITNGEANIQYPFYNEEEAYA